MKLCKRNNIKVGRNNRYMDDICALLWAIIMAEDGWMAVFAIGMRVLVYQHQEGPPTFLMP